MITWTEEASRHGMDKEEKVDMAKYVYPVIVNRSSSTSACIVPSLEEFVQCISNAVDKKEPPVVCDGWLRRHFLCAATQTGRKTSTRLLKEGKAAGLVVTKDYEGEQWVRTTPKAQSHCIHDQIKDVVAECDVGGKVIL